MRTLTEQKRTDILNAAAAVFLEHGYERASMNEVAKRAGGSKATLYNYYSSKESLFNAVVCTYATLFLIRAAQELSSAEQEKLTFADKLQRFGEVMLGAMTSDWKAMQLYRMVVGEAAYSDIGELFYDSGVRESMHALEELMQRHMESGDLSPGCPVLRAKQFSALVKAEADELFLKRELPVYSAKQVAAMVASAVAVFLQGAR